MQILYEDEHLVAVAKPENVLCVPGLHEPENLYDHVRAEFPNARVVHRLDMATSGIVLFALNHASQKALGLQFEKRLIHKRYTAIVDGVVGAACGEIVLPLLCDWPNRPRQKVDWRDGKAAHTLFRVIDRADHATLLQLSPVTGRSHQLRVHCLQIGHPVLGDTLYNPASRAPRMMLHAEMIEFLHPLTSSRINLYCPAPFNLVQLQPFANRRSSSAT